jgi:hypothetical protein
MPLEANRGCEKDTLEVSMLIKKQSPLIRGNVTRSASAANEGLLRFQA